MRDGDGEIGGAHPAPDRGADERWLDTPSCPSCLTRMEAAESVSGAPYWACPECGTTAIA